MCPIVRYVVQRIYVADKNVYSVLLLILADFSTKHFAFNTSSLPFTVLSARSLLRGECAQ